MLRDTMAETDTYASLDVHIQNPDLSNKRFYAAIVGYTGCFYSGYFTMNWY